MSLGHTQQLTPSSVNCPLPTVYNWPSLVLDRNLCVVGAPLQSIRSPVWSLTAEMSFDQGWPRPVGEKLIHYQILFRLGKCWSNVLCDMCCEYVWQHSWFHPSSWCVWAAKDRSCLAIPNLLAWQFLISHWSSQSNFNHGLTRFCTHNM